jgi:hypothetical protein
VELPKIPRGLTQGSVASASPILIELGLCVLLIQETASKSSRRFLKNANVQSRACLQQSFSDQSATHPSELHIVFLPPPLWSVLIGARFSSYGSLAMLAAIRRIPLV